MKCKSKCVAVPECKSVGLASLTFCVGVVAGLVLPICAVAVLEAIMILVMGYCCLFKW